MLSPLPADFEPTRATLHAYALAASVIPRAHATPHEKWWHVALRVGPEGWTTERIRLPGGGSLTLRIDVADHTLVVDTADERTSRISLEAGLTGSQFGDRLIAAVAELGLTGEYARDKFESDEPRVYDPDVATSFASTLNDVAAVFEKHRSGLPGDVGHPHLWPHGFDFAMEWFGTRVERHEEHGELQEFPAQLNLGFYPGGRAYFYSNPWPFDADEFLGHELPHDAEWHTEGWEGSIYHYDLLAGDEDGERKLAEYARAVFDIASPTLMAK